ncbi:hypothetical protein [Cutibacterium sp.]|nr:hypothetical protein [Cutibacterium sp.]MDO4412023.1 hypothetical protein [Cutibacterium sp.]
MPAKRWLVWDQGKLPKHGWQCKWLEDVKPAFLLYGKHVIVVGICIVIK